jgi:hypothetical protein
VAHDKGYNTNIVINATGQRLARNPEVSLLVCNTWLAHPDNGIIVSTLGIVATLLHEVDEDAVCLAFFRAGIARALRRHLSSSDDHVVSKAMNTTGWLACSGRVAQQHLIDAGFVEIMLQQLGRCRILDEDIWSALNWLLSLADGRTRFIAHGGLALLLEELQNHPLSLCASPILAVRKMAKHAPSRDALRAARVHENLLCELCVPDVHPRMYFACAVALTTLAPVEAQAALDRAADTMEPAQDLHVLYPTVADQTALLSQAPTQRFGLWWLLHLVLAEGAGYYVGRDYASMMTREPGLLPSVVRLTRVPHARALAVRLLVALCEPDNAARRGECVARGAVPALLEALPLLDQGGGTACARALRCLVRDAPLVTPCTGTLRDSAEQCLVRQATSENDAASAHALLEYATALQAWRLHCAALRVLVLAPEPLYICDDVIRLRMIMALA